MPERKKLQAFLPMLKEGYEESPEGIRWAASLFHDREKQSLPQYEWVALRDPEGYPMNRGMVVTSGGRNFPMKEFLASIEEYEVKYSNALHSGKKENSSRKPYMLDPISRLNLNYGCLPGEIRTLMKDSGITLPLTDVSRLLEVMTHVSPALYTLLFHKNEPLLLL